MSEGVLLLDDGELEELASVLTSLGVAFSRVRGGDSPSDLGPPRDLLVATPRRAGCVSSDSAGGGPTDRPLRIVAVDEDSNAMRDMVRRLGFHWLVRLPAHREMWRLLVQRALYAGEERRSESRVAASSEVSVTTGRARHPALLVEASPQGCRLVSRDSFETGARVVLELDTSTAGRLQVSGHLARTEGVVSDDGDVTHSAALIFAADLPEETRAALAAWLRDELASGSGSTGVELRPCNGSAPSGSGSERRRGPRGAYTERVVAVDHRQSRVLMGRDLSAGGMRVERLAALSLGDAFRIAVYGPTRTRPFVLDAVVVRDDGADGFALRFEDVPADVASELEKLVACLPDVESLESGEIENMGSVISEILPD